MKTTDAQPTIDPGEPPRARFVPDEFPVPHYLIPLRVAQAAGFAPAPPPRGFFVYDELPRAKLRGLGPADSLILRHAIHTGAIDVTRFYLAPLVPKPLASEPEQPIPASRDLLLGSIPPFQPDGAYVPAGPPIAAVSDREPQAPVHHRVTRQWLYILEIKPSAGYLAAGQVLAYVWAWNRLFAARWPARPLILTDLPQHYLPEFAEAYAISVISLGHLLTEPPPFPT